MLNTNTQSSTLIKIETILGQILYEDIIQFNENKNTHQINIEHINPGSYFLTATSDTNNCIKIIKLAIID